MAEHGSRCIQVWWSMAVGAFKYGGAWHEVHSGMAEHGHEVHSGMVEHGSRCIQVWWSMA